MRRRNLLLALLVVVATFATGCDEEAALSFTVAGETLVRTRHIEATMDSLLVEARLLRAALAEQEVKP